MRISDWIIRLLMLVILGLFLYAGFQSYQHYQNISKQQPNRPTVRETLDKIGNGQEATLDAEDLDDEDTYDLSTDKAISTIKDGVNATGKAVKDGTGAAAAALKEGASAVADKAEKYIPTDPSINDLVALKEAEAKKMEAAQSNGEVSSYNSSSNGNYLVVAGTFRQMINAEQELAKLKAKGYDNAYIAKFNKSTYASLIIDRFDSSASAKQYVKSLKQKGMEAYVHKKR